MISYVMQLSILLATWLSIDALLGRSHRVWKWCLRGQSARSRWRRPWFDDKFQDVKGALLSTAVEFQKTRVFFVATIQVASLLALGSVSDIGASDWRSLRANTSFIPLLASLGICPVVLNLLSLRKDSTPEWFLLIISTFAICISAAIVSSPTYSEIFPSQMSSLEQPPPLCGGFAPGQSLFYPKNGSDEISVPGWPLIVPTPLAIMFCLVLEKIKFRLPRSRGTETSPQNISTICAPLCQGSLASGCVQRF